MKVKKLKLVLIKWLIHSLNFKDSCIVYFIWKLNHKKIINRIFENRTSNYE